MEKIINILWIIFILIGLFIIIITYCYFIQKYKYVMVDYKQKQEIVKKIYVSKSQNYKKTIIKSNMTERIDIKDIKNNISAPIIIFYFNGKKTKSIKLNGNRENIFIGRSKSDDIVINEPTVSRSQCYIIRDNGDFFITVDINKNPVYLNSRLIETKMKLYNNDLVSMANGKIYFKFYCSEEYMLKNNNERQKDTN